jgi:dihydroxyacetone kinase-like protein
MKKIINDPFDVTDETIEGILAAHPDHLKRVGDTGRALVRQDAPVPGKVGIVTGGGSGHLPTFLGYVGPGLADGVAVGNVFSSPGPQPMLDCIKAVDSGAGVLILFGNYQGDCMNFEMAARSARELGIDVEMAIMHDDVASAPPSRRENRRGVAGLYYAYKLLGARAEQRASLAELKDLAADVMEHVRTVGVALTACTVPAAGKPTFHIADDEMELGMGIHGEPGVERGKLETADALAKRMVQMIVDDMRLDAGSEVSVLVNGLGATPPEELYVFYRGVREALTTLGIEDRRTFIGEYATALEMAGCSLSLLRLNDTFKELLDVPCHSPFLLQKH